MPRSLAVRLTQDPKRLPLQRVLLAHDMHVLRWVLNVGSLSCSSLTTWITAS
jgi:hypothetical protein